MSCVRQSVLIHGGTGGVGTLGGGSGELPIGQAADAHTILREGGHIGKVILEVAPPSGDHRRGRRRKA